VEANSTGGQGSRRAVAPSDDDENYRSTSVGCLKGIFLSTCASWAKDWRANVCNTAEEMFLLLRKVKCSQVVEATF
jgi:hypothetical protein